MNNVQVGQKSYEMPPQDGSLLQRNSQCASSATPSYTIRETTESDAFPSRGRTRVARDPPAWHDSKPSPPPSAIPRDSRCGRESWRFRYLPR